MIFQIAISLLDSDYILHAEGERTLPVYHSVSEVANLISKPEINNDIWAEGFLHPGLRAEISSDFKDEEKLLSLQQSEWIFLEEKRIFKKINLK